MAVKTQLSPTAIPGKRYSFSAKTATTVWTSIILQGFDAISGKVVMIRGKYKADQNKTDIDALGLSHDSLVDVSSDDHHAQAHIHDGDTLQLDGINSDGGAFVFTTSGAITFNQSLIIDGGNIGITADTDLIGLASGLLKIRGNIVIPKASGNGIKVDNTIPTFGWRDLRAEIRTRGVGGTDPNDTTYIGNVKAYSFSVNDEAWIEFHIPHDYVKGTNIHLHFHWSHNSAIVTGGSVTFGADVTYAKGHNQAAFAATVNPTLSPNASTIQYRHMVSEIQLSASSPSATQIDTDDLEPDGLILARVYLSANNITSGGAIPDPFIHEVDLHYQSTSIATKDKVPDFYT